MLCLAQIAGCLVLMVGFVLVGTLRQAIEDLGLVEGGGASGRVAPSVMRWVQK